MDLGREQFSAQEKLLLATHPNAPSNEISMLLEAHVDLGNLRYCIHTVVALNEYRAGPPPVVGSRGWRLGQAIRLTAGSRPPFDSGESP